MENNCRKMTAEEMLAAVETAFSDGQFYIYLQPQYNHINRRIVGAEALVRWLHPLYGMQSPADFIPLFEEKRIITRLDMYVFEKLCCMLHECISQSSRVVPVSFNVSRYDLDCSDFAERMEEIRCRYDVPVKYLRVEITESAAIGNIEHLQAFIDKLHGLGYIVEMDDFGSGYSSLNVLKDIEVDIIKLDMMFLKGDIGGRGGIIVSSVVHMANWLGTPVIAEGVETPEQADYMKSIGCSYIQGYYYSKPLPESEYISLINDVKIDEAVPAMKFIDTLHAEKFWNPDTLETLIFNNYVGGAAIFMYENDTIEMLRVNDKYLKELGMNMTQSDVIKEHTNLNLDDHNEKIYISTVKRAIESNDEEVCETWRKVHSACCGEDNLCIRTAMRVIGRADNQYLFYAMIHNITATKLAYLDVAESEKKFRMAGEQANIYCWEYEIDTKEMRPCLRCRRDLGLPAVLKNYPEPVIESGLFPADYAEMYRDWHRQLAEGAQSLEAVIPLTQDRVPFHVRYTAEFDENGNPYKAYGSATLVV